MKRAVIIISIAIAAAALWRFVRIAGGVSQAVAELAQVIVQPVTQGKKLARLAWQNVWAVLRNTWSIFLALSDILMQPRIWGEVLAASKDFLLARLANPFSIQSALESYDVFAERVYQARFGRPSANFNYRRKSS
jgi:hypothetical protein